jgi:hypothetical protein
MTSTEEVYNGLINVHVPCVQKVQTPCIKHTCVSVTEVLLTAKHTDLQHTWATWKHAYLLLRLVRPGNLRLGQAQMKQSWAVQIWISLGPHDAVLDHVWKHACIHVYFGTKGWWAFGGRQANIFMMHIYQLKWLQCANPHGHTNMNMHTITSALVLVLHQVWMGFWL